MFSITKVLRTCGLITCVLINVHSLVNTGTEPWIESFQVVKKSVVDNNCKYLLNVRGGDYLGHYSWRLTPREGLRGSLCEVISSNYDLREIKTEKLQTEIEVAVPNADGKIYFCVHHADVENRPFGGFWVHQGPELFLNPKNDGVTQKIGENATRQKSNLQESPFNDLTHDTDVNYLPSKKRLTRQEQIDVEVFNKDPNDVTPLDNEGYRTKRDVNGTARYDKKEKRITRQEQIDVEVFLRNTHDRPLDYEGYRTKRDINNDTNKNKRILRQVTASDMDFDYSSVKSDPVLVTVEGIRVEESEKEPKTIEGGVPSVLANSKFSLRLFGQGFTKNTVISFTQEPLEYSRPCKFLEAGEYKVIPDSVTLTSALFEVTAPQSMADAKLYICAKNLPPGITDPKKDEKYYRHQGTENWKTIATHHKLLPLWATLILILVCLMFSALFSGLNLGLMSLDRTELKIISNTGTEQERKYARAIMPVRDHGNYLLCSILLGNVAVNSTFTILLDDLTSGLFAVIFSTLAIVLLGEITPQAICSRHGLMVGAKSIVVTKGVMALTAPLAYPVSKLLDYFLGEEIGNVYNRERLKELVKVTTDQNDLDRDEVNIISGALEMRKKTVSDVMTKLEDVFMLPITSVLDFETMSEIVKSGYSRIPVYEGTRGNIVTVLFIKDLAFVDPDDNTPLRTLAQYYQNPCNFVFEDVTLDVMFKQFKDGHKGHMAFVHRINNEGEGDPFYETIGLVTLEDVIEEMIQAEIVDETDVFMDNRTKRRRNKPTNKLQDFAAFAERHENQRTHISPQLTLATFQYLNSSVEAFRPEIISETVLRRLLRQDVIHHIKLKGKSRKDPSIYVYQQGKPVDYFVLILEGRVEVTVGRENLVFEAGPFTYFGVQALTQNIGVAESPTPSAMGSLQNINMDSMLRHSFVPDYSVVATVDLFYLTVKRSLYLAAKRATLMEKGALSKGATNDQLDNELDKQVDSPSNPIFLISKKLDTSASTVSNTAENVASTANSNKSTQRPIIELMQVSPNQNYASSEKLEIYDKYAHSTFSSSTSKHCPNVSRSEPSKCLPNASIKNAEDSNEVTTKSLAYVCDDLNNCWPNTASSFLTDIDYDSYRKKDGMANDIDANTCAECVKNNFWPNKGVLNKSMDSWSYGAEHETDPIAERCDIGSHYFSEVVHCCMEDIFKLLNRECEWRINYSPSIADDIVIMAESLGDLSIMLEDLNRLLQSVDEDISISGEHKTPSRQVSPNPPPVSASPHTRSSFVSRTDIRSPEPRNGDYIGARDEQEKLLK